MLIWSCSSRYKSSKGAYESHGKSRFFDTKRSYRRTNSSSSIKPSLWLIRSRFRTFLKATARATSRRTKSRRLLKTTHGLTFLFPTKNEILDPILLGLRTSSSSISLSMLKVPNKYFWTTCFFYYFCQHTTNECFVIARCFQKAYSRFGFRFRPKAIRLTPTAGYYVLV